MPANFKSLRLLLVVVPLAAVLISCVQESNTYPIDIFTEMHYSQSYRNSEPSRPDPQQASIAIDHYGELRGGVDAVLDVDAVVDGWRSSYSPEEGAVLYNRFCSSCHGASGLGDGPVAAHFQNPDSYYVEVNSASEPYAGPANLQLTRQGVPKDIAYSVVLLGRNGMPNFKHLDERTIQTIVEYVYDEAYGLGSS